MRDAVLARTARVGVSDGALADFADNTADALHSGSLHAASGAVERFVANAARELRHVARGRPDRRRRRRARAAPARRRATRRSRARRTRVVGIRGRVAGIRARRSRRIGALAPSVHPLNVRPRVVPSSAGRESRRRELARVRAGHARDAGAGERSRRAEARAALRARSRRRCERRAGRAARIARRSRQRRMPFDRHVPDAGRRARRDQRADAADAPHPVPRSARDAGARLLGLPARARRRASRRSRPRASFRRRACATTTSSPPAISRTRSRSVSSATRATPNAAAPRSPRSASRRNRSRAPRSCRCTGSTTRPIARIRSTGAPSSAPGAAALREQPIECF